MKYLVIKDFIDLKKGEIIDGRENPRWVKIKGGFVINPASYEEHFQLIEED